ncbi:hypothetical protein Strvi_0154 (plasmid) [Streptomyces violaceusniger Tu 4113]|uniref:Uncharacterized protein n=2 Tax=Streptomyces violaceusniger TaxID=68280 RepID=G2PHX8_STRV4|nr:hypothetical protein Strvi_0154 [Streptomyces violaceusniger Tu 4113]
MLFVPSDCLNRAVPDRSKVYREMCEALGASASQVPVPTVVVAPSTMFDAVWQAIVHNNWSAELREGWIALHSEGRIDFVPRN